MNPLTPIAVPVSRRWREFRIRVAPGLVFVASLGAAVYLWRTSLSAPLMQAVADAPIARVSSAQAGTLTELNVVLHQKVAKGDVLGSFTPVDLRAPLAVMQSELNLLRGQLRPRLDQLRNLENYEKLRIDLLQHRVQLASDKVTLRRAESEFERVTKLFQEKLVSDAVFELSQRDRDLAKVEVDERTKLIADFEASLQRLGGLSAVESDVFESKGTLALIASQEERLKKIEALLGPTKLTATIDGVVTAICHLPGENVREEEPIVVISAVEPVRLVGYLRQPLPPEVHPGMAVEVRTRSFRPSMGTASVLSIGPRLEPITNSLAMVRQGTLVDMGLPVEVSIPRGLRVRPGETVDLVIAQPGGQ